MEARDCVVRDCVAFLNTGGICTSSGRQGGGRLENLIAWGNQAGDVWIKGVSGETGISRSFTARGTFT